MKRNFIGKACALAVILMLTSLAVAAGGGGGVTWTNISSGIDYAQINYTVNTSNPPQIVHVARMNKTASATFIEAALAGNQMGQSETVPDQVARWEDAISYWGNGGTAASWGFRNDVKIAINGSLFSNGTPILTGGIVHAGSYDKRFDDYNGWGVFVWNLDRTAYISKDVYNNPSDQYVVLGSSSGLQFTGLNSLSRDANSLILYTPQFGAATPASPIGDSVEIVVQMDTPPMLVASGGISGTIKLVRSGVGIGSTPIAFGTVVISAAGSAAGDVLACNPQVGMSVEVSQKVNESGSYSNFDNVYSAMSGNRIVLYAGKMPLSLTDPENTTRDSRTAVAYNSTYVYFVVADANLVLPASAGMSLIELGNFCKDRNTLNATHAVNMDGGKSSTMWVEGRGVVNTPDDTIFGPWPVAGSFMMVSETSRSYSTKFLPGDVVEVQNATIALSGPGTNFPSQGSRLIGNIGVVQDFVAAGVYAKGAYWWPVKFNDDIAPVWVNSADLKWISSGPGTILIDDGDPGFSRSGSGWTYYSGQPDSINGDHWDLCCSIPTFPTSAYAEYRPTITEAGEYRVEYVTGGSTTGMEDWNIFEVHRYDPATSQWTSEPYWLWPTITGGNWRELGNEDDHFYFLPGTTGCVRISNGTGIPFQSAGYKVRADAVRFTRIGPLP